MPSIKFNGYELQTGERIVTTINDYASPPIEITEMSAARLDGSVITNARFMAKRIAVTGALQAPTQSGFLGLVDELKFKLSPTEKLLTITDTDSLQLAIEQAVNTNDAACVATQFVAQSFLSPVSGARILWQSYIRKGETNNLTYDLCLDNSNKPGTILASTILSNESKPTSNGWVDIYFNYPIVAGIKYWVKVKTTSGGDYIRFSTGNNYPNGNLSVSDDGSDTTYTDYPSYDLAFRLYVFQTDIKEYVASVIGTIKIPHEHWVTTSSPYELEFLCANPFGQDAEYTTWSGVTVSGRNSFADVPYAGRPTITFSGSAPPLPIITLDVTSGYPTEIGLTELATSGRLTVSRPVGTFAYKKNDQLIINCEDRSVKLNGANVAYSGLIPEFSVGSEQRLSVDVRQAAGTTTKANTSDSTSPLLASTNSWLARKITPTLTGLADNIVLTMTTLVTQPTVTLALHADDNGGNKPGTLIATTSGLCSATTYTSQNVAFNFPLFKPPIYAGSNYWIAIQHLGSITSNQTRMTSFAGSQAYYTSLDKKNWVETGGSTISVEEINIYRTGASETTVPKVSIKVAYKRRWL